MPERVTALARRIGEQSTASLADLDRISRSTRILGLNALVEAARAGDQGRSFAVVAREVRDVADQASAVSRRLAEELGPAVEELVALGEELVARVRGQRLADLALTAVELVDRNLYERTCDVRWWATDADLVAAAGAGAGSAEAARASQRLATILRSYTVYLDLWVTDRTGRVIATGAGQSYPDVLGTDVSGEPWWRDALSTADGDAYAVADVARSAQLGAPVATYSTAVRAGGAVDGEVLGALGVFFDWGPQSRAILDGLRLGGDEVRTRKVLLGADGLVLASSDGRGELTETLALPTEGREAGHFTDGERTVGFARTPGYETYAGLGWIGALIQG